MQLAWCLLEENIAYRIILSSNVQSLTNSMKAKLDAQVVTVEHTIEEIHPGVLWRIDVLRSGQSELKTSLEKNNDRVSNVEKW